MIGPPFTLPTPVLVRDSKAVILTRLFSWLSACLLAGAVVIALVAVTSDRNDLREQLRSQTDELACRSVAVLEVNRATAERDNTIAYILIAFAGGETQIVIDTLIEELKLGTATVDEAIDAQGLALVSCSNQ